MTPPRIMDQKRWAIFAWLAVLALIQAMALAGVAIATRVVFATLHGQSTLGLPLIAALGAAGLITALAQYAMSVKAEQMGQDYAGAVRAALFEHASRTDQSTQTKRRFGYQLLRFTGDLSALKNWPCQGVPRLIQAVVLLPASAGVLWVLHPSFGQIGLGLIIGSMAFLTYGFFQLSHVHKRLRKRRAKLAADMAERVPIAPQLAAFGRRSTELRHLSGQVSLVAEAAVDARKRASVLSLMPEALAALAACLMLWVGASEGVAPANLAAALAALGLAVRPLQNAASALNQAASFRVAFANLSRALARPTLAQPKVTKRLKARDVVVEIQSDGVAPIRLGKGETACVPKEVMRDLVPILSGAQAGPKGLIAFNGEDLTGLSPGSLRRNVAIVTDDPVLLKASLRKNLTLALSKRPEDAQIKARIDAAGLDQALDALGGLDRSVAERGADLNRYERETVSILRAAISQPALVVDTLGTRELPKSLCQNCAVLRIAPAPNGTNQ